MRYQLLGKSGLRVSEICLGTMTFGEVWGWGASRQESQRIFDAFVEAGGNFIDTSNNYTDGESESFLGEFIHADRDHYVIATKYTLTERKSDPNFGGNQRKNLRRSVEGSLRRLQTDTIDLLYLHMWDFTTPVEEVMRSLDDLVASGKVLYVGISDTPAWVVSQANMLADLRGWSRFVAYQGLYNLLDRDPERDLLPMAAAGEMTFLAWGVLDGGGLTGKYNQPANGSTRYDAVAEDVRKTADMLMAMAKQGGVTPAQIAINWVRQRKQPIIPILGARSLTQMQDNLGCLDFELSQEQLASLDEAAKPRLGFPQGFLTSDHVRGLIFGETFDRLHLAR